MENVPCAPEKNIYSATFGWNVPYICVHVGITFIWPNVSFKANSCMLIFCLDDLSIDKWGIKVA